MVDPATCGLSSLGRRQSAFFGGWRTWRSAACRMGKASFPISPIRLPMGFDVRLTVTRSFYRAVLARMDWGIGQYERMAVTLDEASQRAIEAAGVSADTRVLDLGCGTGNAAIAAAKRGARVVAVDPAERLVGVCRARAEREGVTVETKLGDAGNIPAQDGTFDVVVSVFAVIFAPDAERAAAEMARVVRRGGRIVITSWVPAGPIAEAGALLRAAMAALTPSATRAAPAWGDPTFIRKLLSPYGEVGIEEAALTFEAASPEAWFAEQEAAHPIWRGVRESLVERPGAWERLRAESIAKLSAGNEDPAKFRATSRYLVIVVDRTA